MGCGRNGTHKNAYKKVERIQNTSFPSGQLLACSCILVALLQTGVPVNTLAIKKKHLWMFENHQIPNEKRDNKLVFTFFDFFALSDLFHPLFLLS